MTVVAPSPVLLGAIVLVALVLVAAVLLARRRRPGLEIRKLNAAEAQRYLETLARLEGDFERAPEVAVAQARGLVEEVLRRMGFPDRVDAAQKARDLAAHDRVAAAALEAADRSLRAGGGPGPLADALSRYRKALDHLLEDATAS
jgi:hypothetical protein